MVLKDVNAESLTVYARAMQAEAVARLDASDWRDGPRRSGAPPARTKIEG